MAKDLTDPAVESDDVNGVAVRNGSSDAMDHYDDDPAELDVLSEHPQTFVVRHARPYESPGRSARNHWQLVTVFALLGVLIGAAFAFVRSPTYTAQQRLVVGKTAQLSQLSTIPGLDLAGQNLAAAYSRLVDTDEVQAAVAKKLGGTMNGTLAASPIPDSPIVRLDATGASEADALAIAKAGSQALVATVNDLNSQQGKASEALLKQYEDANAIVISAQNQVNQLTGQYNANAGNTPAQAALQIQLDAAQAKVDSASVKAQALVDAYKGTFDPTAINSQVIQPVGQPKATGNNRRSTLEAGLLIGLVAGGLIGLGLAVWIDLRARAAR
jgi:capsular polysaccharide biosynthesis protein